MGQRGERCSVGISVWCCASDSPKCPFPRLRHIGTCPEQMFPGKTNQALPWHSNGGDRASRVSCSPLLSTDVPLGWDQHQTLSFFQPSGPAGQTQLPHYEGKEGLGGEFGLPPCSQPWLHTHSRCFGSSCAIGVHVFQLFFQPSSHLSLKTHKKLLFSEQRCPAQPRKPEPPPKANVLSTKLLLCYRRGTDPILLLPSQRAVALSWDRNSPITLFKSY